MTYTVTVRGGAGGRHRHRGQPAGGERHLELQHAGGVPVHGVRANGRTVRRRGTGSAARGGREAAGRRGRLAERAALLQAGEQHRHPRRARLVRQRPAAGGGRVHGRDGVRVAAAGAARTRPHRPRHDLRRLVPLERRVLRVQPGRDVVGRPPSAAARARPTRSSAATASTATGRAASRDSVLERHELLGRRCLRAHPPAGHARAQGRVHVAGRAARPGWRCPARSRSTFDEPLDPNTVNAGSITLKDGTGAPVVGHGHLRRADPQGHPDAAVAADARQGATRRRR